MERFFEEEMRLLNRDLMSMAALVEQAIGSSIEALKKQDLALARRVVEADRDIDDMELRIEHKAINLLALRQPMARDLRFVVTTGIKINSELERMADMAVNIAQRVLELGDQPLLRPLIDIPRLTTLVSTMVKQCIDAFVNQDEQLAQAVICADAEADALKNKIHDELLNDYIVKDSTTAPRAVPLLLIARHLERIGDHATNIAEDVIYLTQAKVVKHHRERIVPPSGGARGA